MIEVRHVYKSFREVDALKDVSLTCRAGEICGLIGHNGSGKTVLLKCICGFLHCESGEILIEGKQVGKDMDMLKNAGIIIEQPGFIHKASGYKNLEYLYLINNEKNKEYIQAIMKKVGLDPFIRRSVGKYSLGMRQRLALAQAIMEDPKILILDEPMNGLDKGGIQEMRELFLDMKEQGKTILLASHNREDIEILCDVVYEMENGTIACKLKK